MPGQRNYAWKTVADRIVATVVQTTQFFLPLIRELWFFPAQFPLDARHRHALARPQLNEVSLKLDNRGRDAQEQLACEIGWIIDEKICIGIVEKNLTSHYSW